MEFINGVELLSTVNIVDMVFQWNLFSIIIACIGAVLTITLIIIMIYEWDISHICLVSLLIFLFFIFAFVSGFTEYETDDYEYKVTISDEVNFKEFNEKYEIVDEEGKIFTIRIRGDD